MSLRLDPDDDVQPRGVQKSSRYDPATHQWVNPPREAETHPDGWKQPEAELNDGDYALAPDPEPPASLSSEELLRLGALTLHTEESDALEQVITDQTKTYKQMLHDDPAQLVTILLERDRALATMGRNVASQRTQGRLLREIMRGLLQTADHASLRRVGDATKTGAIEGILEALGCEPADLRQLRENGSTLGRLKE